MEILCFFAGVAFVYTKSTWLPVFLLVVLLFKPRATLVVWFLAAIVWCAGHQLIVSRQFMPDHSVIQNAHLQGYVVTIPTISATKTQFQFQATQLNGQPVNALLLLSCYNHCPDFRAGQSWKLHAKLQKPHNLANPGGFDYAGWLHSRHISWTGYVRQGGAQLTGQSLAQFPVITLRQYLAQRLKELDPNPETLGILQALTLGVTTHIDKAGWDLFRRTGTTHLIVISGSHIALVAGLAYGLVKWLWCWMGSLCLRIPAPRVASVAGFMIATGYSLLAGFEVPSQRALIVCFFMFLRNFCSQRFGVWQAWRYALLVVLLFEPHSVLMPGFYLSFLAVAILVLINQRFSATGVREMLILQLACLAGLMPLTLYLFSYGAVNGLVANLIAIPWVSFIIVPLGLFVTFFGHVLPMPWLVSILTHAIDYLLYFLRWVDSYAWVNLSVSIHQFLTPLALMITLTLLVLLPLMRLVPVLLVIAIAALFPAYEKIKPGEVKINIMDVGQGLAVVVHTARHLLIYDTGVKFYRGGDMGQLAIIPYLETLGVKSVDTVIISHPDLDHRGGLRSLEEKYKVRALIVDDPGYYKRGLSCHQYPDWNWDGIAFHFFPITSLIKSKNNASCVLQISTPGGEILLSGDIEKPAEDYLSETYKEKLASSILVIPHHGSKTSSSARFVSTVSPRYAVVSYGFNNRYHFPHQQALQVYQQNNIPVFNTVDCGMMSVWLGETSMSEQPVCYRSLQTNQLFARWL